MKINWSFVIAWTWIVIWAIAVYGFAAYGFTKMVMGQ